ncbi:MAG: hypothetical protein HKN20_04075, partial [Gemmatimonadetes bacterium]|nr:hypothetical protein [Gemmatimonadota bacterium]
MPAPHRPSNGARFVPVAAGALSLFALAFFATRPPTWFYSLGWAADLAPGARGAWLVISLSLLAVAAMPRWQGSIARFTRRVPPFLLIAVPLVLLAVSFRSVTHFWGDGWLILTFIEGDPPDRLRPGLGTIYALRALYRVLVDTGVPDPGKTVFLLA